MKRLLLICTALIAASASAQVVTNPPTILVASTNVGQLLGVPPSVIKGWNGFLGGLVDAAPYISNDIVNVDFGALYNSSDKHGKFGGYLAASVPTSQQSAIGVGGFYLNNQLGNATVNLTLGTTVSNLPILGKVWTFASSGPDYDFTKDPSTGKAFGIGAYNAFGVQKTWELNMAAAGAIPTWYQNWSVGIKVGGFNISTIPGLGEFGGLELVKHF